MNKHTINYAARYNIPSVQQQTEAAVMRIAERIFAGNTKAPPPGGSPSDELRWAQWAVVNSSVAGVHFGWAVAFDPKVEAAIEADPSGSTVNDEDVTAAVEKAFPNVLANFLANPPPGTPTIP
jgi:hypothetical protein